MLNSHPIDCGTESDLLRRVDVVYENQRYYPIKKWSSTLLPTDRSPYSDIDGRLTYPPPETTPLPNGWEWETEWKCSDWEYAVDFPALFDPKEGTFTMTRRKKWERTRITKCGVRPANVVNILSYNFFLRPRMISNAAGDFKDERIPMFLKYLDSFDIICFQEVFGAFSSRKSDIIQYAHELGMRIHYAAPPRPMTSLTSGIVDDGLLLLSRYPISKSSYIRYSQGISSDKLAAKGAIYSLIEVGNAAVQIITTHTQASYYDGADAIRRAVRKSQLQELHKFCINMFNELDPKYYSLPLLVVGDFNVNSYNDTPNSPKELEDEYTDLVQSLAGEDFEVEDLIFSQFGEHPVTYGEFPDVLVPRECQIPQSLDYLFKLTPRYPPPLSSCRNREYLKTGEDPSHGLPSPLLNVRGVKVEKFENDCPAQLFKFLSDHYGVSVQVELKSEDSHSDDWCNVETYPRPDQPFAAFSAPSPAEVAQPPVPQAAVFPSVVPSGAAAASVHSNEEGDVDEKDTHLADCIIVSHNDLDPIIIDPANASGSSIA